jgi:hypothetical protein
MRDGDAFAKPRCAELLASHQCGENFVALYVVELLCDEVAHGIDDAFLTHPLDLASATV